MRSKIASYKFEKIALNHKKSALRGRRHKKARGFKPGDSRGARQILLIAAAFRPWQDSQHDAARDPIIITRRPDDYTMIPLVWQGLFCAKNAVWTLSDGFLNNIPAIIGEKIPREGRVMLKETPDFTVPSRNELRIVFACKSAVKNGWFDVKIAWQRKISGI